ncbi:hypothetical protein [Roseibium sp.]|uniref:hypothetical protein n=1 Tax=Roseibium sp. TaxID=1936156 RepID=UPI0026334548|nr:hypothetical protein [Roseibium sp.]
MGSLDSPIVQPIHRRLVGSVSDHAHFASDLDWIPAGLVGANTVFSAYSNRYAVKSGPVLQSASVADFYQNYSCSTPIWPVGSAGLPYEVAVDTPAYTYLTGRRGLMIDPGGTRRNDSRPQTGFTLDTFTGTNLPAEGLFEEPMRVASQGATWNRAGRPFTWVAGDPVYLTFQYAAGTSGEVRLTIRSSDSATETKIRGTVGSVVNDETSFGTVDYFKEYALPNGHYLLLVKFTPDANAAGSIGLGPNSSTVGEDVVFYAGQIRDQGFGWIFGDQTQQVTQGPTNLQVADLIETLCVGQDASIYLEFGDTVGVNGSNRLIQHSTGSILRFSSAEAQIAIGIDSYQKLADISTPLSGKVVIGVENGVKASGSFDGAAAETVVEASSVLASDIYFMGAGSNGVCGVLYDAAVWDRQLSDAEMEAVTS